MLGKVLAEYLEKEGFDIGYVTTSRKEYMNNMSSKSRLETANRVGEVIFTQLSRPLKEIIREINVVSNNHYAEHLIRTIGRADNIDVYENALDAGVKYTADFWKSKGIDNSSLHMYDGSGLAPQNAVSPHFLTDLLSYMYNDSGYSDEFFNSLPKAGQEGTVRNFLANSKYSGKASVKSGSIGGVQTYAGYIIDGDKKLAFSIIVNKYNCTRSQVRGAIEQLLLSM